MPSSKHSSSPKDRDRESKTAHRFKLVLLGDASVGKSCLVVRFAKDEFCENQEPTIGAAFMTQTIDLDSKTAVKFEIWDTAGQERYRSLAPMYYRGASAAVIVYDVCSRESFDGAKSWVAELQDMSAEGSELVIALCGNKVDLCDEGSSGGGSNHRGSGSAGYARQVEQETARNYAKEMGILFLETSAKTGQNVKETFFEIAQRLPVMGNANDSAAGKKYDLNAANQNSNAAGGGCCSS